jgi:DNA-directed RNA polymerase specialized sigma24 family protein
VTSEQVQFQEFFAAHYTRLRRLGYRLTGSWMEAEDLAQEAMVRTFWRWRIVRGHDRPEEYARKVLVNRHRSLLRRALVQLASIRTFHRWLRVQRFGWPAATRRSSVRDIGSVRCVDHGRSQNAGHGGAHIGNPDAM